MMISGRVDPKKGWIHNDKTDTPSGNQNLFAGQCGAFSAYFSVSVIKNKKMKRRYWVAGFPH
jgi:hypothetical protein